MKNYENLFPVRVKSLFYQAEISSKTSFDDIPEVETKWFTRRLKETDHASKEVAEKFGYIADTLTADLFLVWSVDPSSTTYPRRLETARVAIGHFLRDVNILYPGIVPANLTPACKDVSRLYPYAVSIKRAANGMTAPVLTRAKCRNAVNILLYCYSNGMHLPNVQFSGKNWKENMECLTECKEASLAEAVKAAAEKRAAAEKAADEEIAAAAAEVKEIAAAAAMTMAAAAAESMQAAAEKAAAEKAEKKQAAAKKAAATRATKKAAQTAAPDTVPAA